MNLVTKAGALLENGAGSPDRVLQEVHLKMALIYRDIHLISCQTQTQRTSDNERLFVTESALRHIDGQYHGEADRVVVRYSEVAEKLGFMMLSILAFSEAFRVSAQMAEDHIWAELVASIDSNFDSIEMFAKSRALAWEPVLFLINSFGNRALTAEQIRSSYDIRFSHPHEWYLTTTGEPRRIRHYGELQVNIEESIFDAGAFRGGKPRNWPAQIEWPINPLFIIPSGTQCAICCQQVCFNHCGRQAYVNPLVEIREYPWKGRGVRALQEIPAKRILAEYVGRILPCDQTEDSIYNINFCLDGKSVATISAAVYGNWTRYVNHSCLPTTNFKIKRVGDKQILCLETIRPIRIFEEITVDYGRWYWSKDRLCRCGEPSCMYDTVEKIRQRILHQPYHR